MDILLDPGYIFIGHDEYGRLLKKLGAINPEEDKKDRRPLHSVAALPSPSSPSIQISGQITGATKPSSCSHLHEGGL